MKQTKVLLTGFLLVAAIMFFAATKYNQVKNNQLDYQIKLNVSYSPSVSDSITLYDGFRKVGTVALTYGEPFAEMILSDNE